MPDDLISLSNRLLLRAPQIGIVLAQQLVNDAWRTLQARKEWSWRRRSGVFAPPDLYQTGSASTNALTGNPLLITGSGTNWTSSMIGRQIRIGGILQPYYTIQGWLSPTELLLDQPWAGPELTSQPYQILQIYYPVPQDFGFFYWAVSVKDAYRLFTDLTENELAVLDPQRTNQGQTYAVALRDFIGQAGGVIGPVIPVTSPTDPAPISTTSTGFSYPANATYIVQVVIGGASGTATFQWLRAGQTSFQPAQLTSSDAQDLADGVQIYWPDSVSYVSGDLFIINCQSVLAGGVPRFELWPAPTFANYLYPYQYFAHEYDLTPTAPALPPPIANRGEVLLELALEKCATFPGPDSEHRNPYFDLKLSQVHALKAESMLIDLINTDENIGIDSVSYQTWPFAGPWGDGSWIQRHAPFLY